MIRKQVDVSQMFRHTVQNVHMPHVHQSHLLSMISYRKFFQSYGLSTLDFETMRFTKILRSSFRAALAKQIEFSGPLTVAQFMQQSSINPLQGYYTNKDPITVGVQKHKFYGWNEQNGPQTRRMEIL